ncbi:MAG: Glu/Leu/Phe/Val dehydrogenase [Deltaproteobacteria bacterium]|nr:MAG: Glu/Leu/Phe/Val dehydrogenase [Deltaproteobacteria bacterium]
MRQDEVGAEAVVRVYDPETGMRGVLVIDSTINGPAGGGTRMVADLTEDEVGELARAMTYKWMIFDLPSGGAKAGIFGDPAMPAEHKRAVLRAFGRSLRPYLSNKDFLLGVGPDMGIAGADVDEIYAGAGAPNPVAWESSPRWIIDGDQAGYHLTGRGVAAAARAALDSIDRPIAGATFALEGFGQVGAGAARYLDRDGARVVAVTTIAGGLHDPQGIDIPRLLELRRQHGDGCLRVYGRGEAIAPDQLWSLPVDVIVPGARPRAIDAYNAGGVRARIVCPAGNLSVTDDAEDHLQRRGVVCVPDFVVNGGAIIATWIDILGGTPAQALAAIARMVAEVTSSILAEARASGRTPGATARARVRDRIFATRRHPISYADAQARAKQVLHFH